VRGVFTGYFALVGARRENAELKARVAALSGAEARLREVELELARLEALAGLIGRTEPRPLGARVVARGGSERYRTVRVDRGTADGVAVGRPAVAPGGAVGQVVGVTGSHADVMLLTDPLSAVAVVVQESRVPGIVEGLGGDGCALRYVPRPEQPNLPVGALLVTSGEDGLFPKGLPVGRVAAILPGTTGLFLDVRVTPAVDVDRVEEVLVLAPASVVGDPPAAAPSAALAGPVAGVPAPPDGKP